ncbi:MAG: hypothetical protein JW807_02835 [Spirochaetes bacterium]|nr:hypothetical protein [Spirochaetota bacterium]
MKKIMILLVLGLACINAGCTYYSIIKKGNPSVDISQYESINVGWLDLGEQRWKQYGYIDKGQWVVTINHMNTSAMPEYFKKLLPHKAVSVSNTKAAKPKKGGLVIKFSDAEYMQRTSTAAKVMFGEFAGSDTLDVTIHFIDGITSRELDRVRVSIYSKSASDISGWGFEGRVNNCVYNLVYFIKERMK